MVRKTIIFIILIGNAFLAFSQDYLNPRLPVEVRVNDLYSRMTLEEKVGQMTQYVGLKYMQGLTSSDQMDDIENHDKKEFYPGLGVNDVIVKIKKGEIGSFLLVKGVDEANYLQNIALQSRLKIPLLIAEDAIHGHARYEGATVFPTPIGMASTFDTLLVKKIASITANEMRQTGYHWTFSPNVDVARDARWGRLGETFGEDPFLVGEMGRAMVKGYQNNELEASVLACGKHFVAGSQPLRGLNFSPMDVSERALNEIWLPPFKSIINEGVATIMAAHHDLNGVPCHANEYLLKTRLREKLGFNGFVVSDWMDVIRLHSLHKIASSQEDANRLAVNAGIDINMHGPGFFETLVAQVEEGKIPEKRIEQAVKSILRHKFRLGLFEQVLVNPSTVNLRSDTAKAIALEAAQKSMVLLKNKNKVLPLENLKQMRIFLTGPNANNQTVLGDWSARQKDDQVITIFDAFKSEQPTLDYYACGDHSNISDKDIEETRLRASESDITFLVLGDNPTRSTAVVRTSGENSDGANIDLFGRQDELIQAAYDAGKPVVVIIISGKPRAIKKAKELASAIIYAWEPGEFGGQALADIVFGRYNPSGKLPVTFPLSSGQLPAFYNHRPAAYFREYNDEPTGFLYEFGSGMHYTTVTYSNLVVDRELTNEQPVSVKFNVLNSGNLPVNETILVYVSDDYASVTTPVKSLAAFYKVELLPNETKPVEIKIPYKAFSLWNQNMERVVEKGSFTILVDDMRAVTELK
ncbi:glycoside hydrolase family 3 N-terminal domain-containing protein [Sunxiuqinia indica]|uniref:glycoside hydrolase family 3 N-terminal domain-containing protein n=1 Tax=Sunxiuqinia indica TaxID=2692584 RepID=UPI001359E303|nr:glycoside hydrolase family 3 N-terminal domain-containing protein [Sunxiuqinia indica]